MDIRSLGHVVLKVRDLDRAEAFYRGVLGLEVVARNDQFGMTFFSLGDHHDFAIQALGDDAETPAANSVGLAHVAFNIGDSTDLLVAARRELAAAGIDSAPVDHEVTQSLYFDDPDGNQIELYVDVSDSWKKEPQRVAQARPLDL